MIISVFLGVLVSGGVHAMPSGEPGSWITPADYPKSELAQRVSGTTAFTLSLDENGEVTDCRVTASSGSAVLDDAACTLLKARAHFSPATNSKGEKIADSYSSRVVWSLPKNAFPVGPQGWAVAVDIDENGVVEKCESIEEPQIAVFPRPDLCNHFSVGRKESPMPTPDGKPMKYRAIFRHSLEIIPR